jgi:hypothetical protein
MIVVGGSRRRAPGIVIRSPPRTPEPETDSKTSVDSEPRDPSYHDPTVIGSSQLAGAPLVTQETPPKRRGRRERANVGSKMSLARSLGGFERRRKSTLRILMLVLRLWLNYVVCARFVVELCGL